MANHTYRRCLPPELSAKVDRAFGDIFDVWERVVLAEATDLDRAILNETMEDVSVLQAVADGLRWKGAIADQEGSQRRMECSGCEVPQACAWIRDCAKWQREQQMKTCPKCDGEGSYPTGPGDLPCGVCGGSGRVPAREEGS